MLEVNGILYYIDLDMLDQKTASLLDGKQDELVVSELEEKEVIDNDGKRTKEITSRKMIPGSESKFKTSIVIDECLRIVLTYREMLEGNDEYDDTKEPTSYKLAFNTLIFNKIIKEYKQ